LNKYSLKTKVKICLTKETKIRYVFLVGLTEDALCQHPSDSELRQISVQFDPSVMYELAIHLGTTIKEWKTVRYDHPENIEDVMFLVLWKWKETTKETFRELAQAVVCVQDNTHKLCMVSSLELEWLISSRSHLFIPFSNIEITWPY
jgi:hypothetical protein